MSIKFFSNDLPAARAYEADQLAAAGYEYEARLVRRNSILNVETAAFIRENLKSVTAAMLMLWTSIAH
jgi:hypothetical protein